MKKTALAALLVAWTAPAVCASYDDLNAGIQYRNLGLWQDCVSYMDKALAPDDLIPSLKFVAYLDRGIAHSNLKQLDLAIVDYSFALGLRPADPQVLVDRATAYWDAGKLDEAAADIDTLVAARPLLSAGYGLRATINARRGQFDKTRQDLKKILSLLPQNTGRDQGIGIIDWQIGDITDAEDNFSFAATRGSGNLYAWLWYVLAEVRLSKDVPRHSLPDFDKKRWPAPIVSFFLGDITQEAVFIAAGQGDAKLLKGQECEADFYVGEWLLQHHDPGAKPMIGKAASTCPTNFIEWQPAQMELANLP